MGMGIEMPSSRQPWWCLDVVQNAVRLRLLSRVLVVQLVQDAVQQIHNKSKQVEFGCIYGLFRHCVNTIYPCTRSKYISLIMHANDISGYPASQPRPGSGEGEWVWVTWYFHAGFAGNCGICRPPYIAGLCSSRITGLILSRWCCVVARQRAHVRDSTHGDMIYYMTRASTVTQTDRQTGRQTHIYTQWWSG